LAAVPTTPPDLSRLCMQLLQPAPTARPSGRTILGQLGATPSPRTHDIARTRAAVPFVGRALDLAELERALGDARRRGVAVIVRGTSGIGKTALVRRFLRSVRDQAFVVEGRCFEREQVPFKMLDGVVDTLTGVIVGLPATHVEALVPRELPALVR